MVVVPAPDEGGATLVADPQEAVDAVRVVGGVSPEQAVDVVAADEVLVRGDDAVHVLAAAHHPLLDPVELVQDVVPRRARAVGAGELVQHDDPDVLHVEGVGQPREQIRRGGEVRGAAQRMVALAEVLGEDLRDLLGGGLRGLVVAAQGVEADPGVVQGLDELALDRQGAHLGAAVVAVVLHVDVVPDLEQEGGAQLDHALVDQPLEASGDRAGVLPVGVSAPLGVAHQADGPGITRRRGRRSRRSGRSHRRGGCGGGSGGGRCTRTGAERTGSDRQAKNGATVRTGQSGHEVSISGQLDVNDHARG